MKPGRDRSRVGMGKNRVGVGKKGGTLGLSGEDEDSMKPGFGASEPGYDDW